MPRAALKLRLRIAGHSFRLHSNMEPPRPDEGERSKQAHEDIHRGRESVHEDCWGVRSDGTTCNRVDLSCSMFAELGTLLPTVAVPSRQPDGPKSRSQAGHGR